MTSNFLKSLVADMQAHGETEAVIDDAGTAVPITFIPKPAPPRRLTLSASILGRFQLLDHANAQRPHERN